MTCMAPRRRKRLYMCMNTYIIILYCKQIDGFSIQYDTDLANKYTNIHVITARSSTDMHYSTLHYTDLKKCALPEYNRIFFCPWKNLLRPREVSLSLEYSQIYATSNYGNSMSSVCIGY